MIYIAFFASLLTALLAADVEIMNNGAFGYGASWTSITGLPYEDHYATVGDTLVFYHSTSHNAVKMLDEESFDNCSPSGSVVVPFSNNDGTETRYTITEDDGTAGTIYFACSMYPLNSWSHCSVGMKVRVHIVGEDEEPAPPSPDLPAPGSPPADVEIMNNGAFGYGASW